MTDKKQEIDAAKSLLRSKGLRATPARIAVVGLLTASDCPMTHLEVTEQLEKVGLEKSTIFRALGDLTEAGLFRKMELGDHLWRYERIGESESDAASHPHLLCVDCGNVQCLGDDEIQLKASKAIGPIEDVLLKGHCKECR